MKNNTLYASEITYEFEKARITGTSDALAMVKDKYGQVYPNNLEYLDDFL